MRKIKSVQNFSSTYSSVESRDIGITDYPTNHRRQKHAVVNQEVIESQMPEHVTLEETTNCVHPPSSEAQYHKNERVRARHAYEQVGRVRTRHSYEQIEISPVEEEGIPPASTYSASVSTDSKRSIKRRSPVIQKNPRDRSGHDTSHAKSLTTERRFSVPIHNNGGKRRSKTARKGSVGSITENPTVSDNQVMQHQMSRYFPAAKSPGERPGRDTSDNQISQDNRAVRR